MKLLKGYSISGIILFALSMIYLGAELVFNRRLLEVSSSVQSDPELVEQIQLFGRVASGLGFTLLVQGIFQRFGFRLAKRRQWTIFAIIALICMAPFVTVLVQSAYEKIAGAAATGDVPYTKGMYWGLLPFAGFFVGLIGRRHKTAVIISLLLMTWPAMFHGQLLAVERFVISPTTAEERLNANFMLLLRSAIEDCTIVPDGTRFCDSKEDAAGEAEKRSTRAVLGALFMLNTEAVFDGLKLSRKQLIDIIAARDMWFSSKGYYQRYLQQVADKRAEYEQYLNDNYYRPYKEASALYTKTYGKATDLYKKAAEPGRFERIANDAAMQAANQVERGWLQYQRAVQKYNSLSARANAVSGMGTEFYSKLCKGRENLCNNAKGNIREHVDMDSIVSQAKSRAAEQFYETTGYPPDLGDKDAFIRNGKTQAAIIEQVEKKLKEHIPDYQLPYGWQYDPETFRNDILFILQDTARGKAVEIANRAKQAWHDNVQVHFKDPIEPGLSREEFFKKAGGAPLPPLKDLVMPEEDFRKKYVVPLNQQIADRTLDTMKKEEASFANRQEQAERGKEYIRVLYIPPIALCLSLVIVVMTIGRYVTMAATDAAKKIRWVRGFSYRQLKMIRPFFWAVYALVVLCGPYMLTNAYTSTVAYQKYYHAARDTSPVIAQALDWVVRVQPVVYRAGSFIPEPTKSGTVR